MNTKFALLSYALQTANLTMNVLVFVELRNTPVGRIASWNVIRWRKFFEVLRFKKKKRIKSPVGREFTPNFSP